MCLWGEESRFPGDPSDTCILALFSANTIVYLRPLSYLLVFSAFWGIVDSTEWEFGSILGAIVGTRVEKVD